MFKVSKPLSADGVCDYRENEYADTAQRYYSDGKTIGFWYGKTAESLGLAGGVRKEHFVAMAHGKHPFTEQQLIRHRVFKTKQHAATEHRAAWDVTISAMKSVSATALVGGDTRVSEAHRQAALIALQAYQGRVQARLNGGRVLTTANFAMAIFEHDTARPVGSEPPAPQLHWHCLLFNMTEADAHKMRSLDPRELYRIQSWATAIYRAELADRLLRLGYEIERTPGHSFEIRGYSREYLDAISPRRDEIKAEMDKRQLQGAAAAEKIALSTRSDKQVWEKQALLAEHQKQAVEFGDQPRMIIAAAQSRSAHFSSQAERVGVAHCGIDYAKERLSERTCCFDGYEVERDALRYGLGRVRYADVKDAFNDRLKASNEFVPVGHYRPYAPGERYTTPEAEAREDFILEFERAGRKRYLEIAAPLTKEDVREEEHLNDPQKWLVWNIAKSKNQVMAVQGGAGTGKSWSLAVVRKIVELHGFETRGLAPTGSAAKELRSKANFGDTLTLQKFLYHSELPEKRCIYFLDESSLASSFQMCEFLQLVRPDDRVVLVGDIRQHGSVEAGRIFEEMIQGGMETFQLEKIVRQQDPVLKEIVQCLAQRNPQAAVALLAEHECIREITRAQDRYSAIAAEFVSDPRDCLIVSVDNESRQAINAIVRDALREAGKLSEDRYAIGILNPRQNMTREDTCHAFEYAEDDVIRYPKGNQTIGVRAGDYATVLSVNTEDNELTVRHEDGREITYNPRDARGVQVFETDPRAFAIGDRIQFTHPISSKRINNRDLGTILKLDESGNARIQLDEGPIINVNLKRTPHIDYAYAMTTYCAEGKTADKLLMHAPVLDSRVHHMIDEAFSYVGSSRPRYRLLVYTDSADDLADAFQQQNHKSKALSNERIRSYQSERTAERVA